MVTRIGNDSANELTGTRHADYLDGRGGNDFLLGLAGNDILLGGDGNDRLKGGSGDDLLDGQRGKDTLLGGDGNDQLYGRGGYDNLYGGDGKDLLNGGNGNDVLHGGRGDDSLFGGDGNDTLRAGTGENQIDAGRGDDLILAGEGFDNIKGGEGIDTISFAYAKGSADVELGSLRGPEPAFSEIGGNQFGGTASDVEIIVGSRFDDFLRGGLGIIEIHGGNGDDNLYTDEFPAALFGDAGNDNLAASIDGDTSMTGGSGRDTFTLSYSEFPNSGGSVVHDFTPGEDLLLFFGDKSTEPSLTNNGDIWTIHSDDPVFGTIETSFQLVDVTSLTPSDYDFV